MATLYIAEGVSIGGNISFATPGMQMPPIKEQTLSIGGASVASQPFDSHTRVVRIHVDAICSIAWNFPGGSAPVASAANMRLVAGQTEYFGASPGQSLAVISNV